MVAEEEEDETMACCVCFDSESNEMNPIVYCEKCNMSVHKACYGIPEVPDGASSSHDPCLAISHTRSLFLSVDGWSL